MKIALAADHGGFDMKQMLIARLREAGHEVTDFGAATPDPDDDYPDYIIPLARAVAAAGWSDWPNSLQSSWSCRLAAPGDHEK